MSYTILGKRMGWPFITAACINYSKTRNTIFWLALLLMGPFHAEARSLKNLDWVQPENLQKSITLILEGVERELTTDIGVITEYYKNKAHDYFFLPDSDALIGQDARDCPENLKNNIYVLRPGLDKPISLPEDLTWAENPFNDRNWQFRFHSLEFVNCLIQGHQAFNDPWYLERMKWVVVDWWRDNFKPDFPSKEFSWYDHTIPRRMHNVLRVWEYIRRNDALDDEFTSLVIKFVYWHARILAEEIGLYVKHHNHGLDQSFRLFEVSQIFPEIKLAKNWESLSEVRLQDELRFALGREGVHVENSPGYHQWISPYSVTINQAFNHYTGLNILDNIDYLAEQGLKFLVAISRPDRRLPRLGDTSNNAKIEASFLNLKELSWYPHYQYLTTDGLKGSPPEQTTIVFPESGYFVYRDFWDEPGKNEATHLVLKCGFLAKGHRHNDDGNILLYGFGEDWLIDTGMYGYKNDQYRRYARSASAHNVSLPFNVEESRNLDRKEQDYRRNWGIIDWSPSHVKCESHMFVGYAYYRTLQITGERSFRVSDKLVVESHDAMSSRYFISIFRVPDNKSVFINQNKSVVSITNTDRSSGLEIRFNKQQIDDVHLFRGEGGEIKALDTYGWTKMVPAKVICFVSYGTSLQAEFEIVLHKSPQLAGFQQLVVSESFQ